MIFSYCFIARFSITDYDAIVISTWLLDFLSVDYLYNLSFLANIKINELIVELSAKSYTSYCMISRSGNIIIFVLLFTFSWNDDCWLWKLSCESTLKRYYEIMELVLYYALRSIWVVYILSFQWHDGTQNTSSVLQIFFPYIWFIIGRQHLRRLMQQPLLPFFIFM